MITVICGLPAAGKSTYAQAERARTGGYIVDMDEIVACMHGTVCHARNESIPLKLLSQTAWMIARQLNQTGTHVYLIRTSLSYDEMRIAKDCVRVLVDTPPDVCRQRMEQRADYSLPNFLDAAQKYKAFKAQFGHLFRTVSAE